MSTLCASPSVLSAPPLVQPPPKKWTRAEVHRLLDDGWFNNQPIELIDGEIILLPTQRPDHAYSVNEVFHGHRYSIMESISATGHVTPLVLPDMRLDVGQLLPRSTA